MIPIILDNTKTLTELVNDKTGIGALAECTSCTVTQERNGAFTFSLKIPMSAKRFEELTVGGILKMKADEDSDLQLFRITKISKPINGIVTVSGNHISYDLNKTSVKPFTSIGAPATMSALKSNMIGGEAFTISTDIENSSSNFSNKIPQSFRALLGGQQGSVLDTFGGEFEFNNNKVILHANRGKYTGIELRYGKNITDLKQEENIESCYTAVIPYALDSTGNAVVGSLQTIVTSAEPKILNLDLSDRFDTTVEEPTASRLNELAQAYIDANDLTTPKVSITVSFVALWQTDQYKEIAPLERVHLCDSVKVVFEKLGVNATAKVVGYKFDVLGERYDSIEIGDAKSTLAKTITGITTNVQNSVSTATGYLDGTINAFTNLIANGLGLFVTKESVGETGGVKIYLHNQPKRADSQFQWTFNSAGFAISQDYGQTWSAGIDADGNAVFNSLAANTIKALSINGAQIVGSNFQSDNGKLHMRMWAGVFELLYETYSKAAIYTNSTGTNGYIRLLDGSTTDANSNPTGWIVQFGVDGLNAWFKNVLYWKLEFSEDAIALIDVRNDTRIGFSQTNGMFLYLNGLGFDNLGFVNDGNGHMVLGK